jgi:hypothetical protein
VLPADQRSLVGTKFPGIEPPEEVSTRWTAPTAELIAASDLERVGALPHDEIDARVLREFEVRAGTQGAPWRKAGDPVPSPAPGPRIEDRDRDGMPDRWEDDRGRDPSAYDPWDDRDCNGWSDLEDYLNERAGDPRVPGDCGQTPGGAPRATLPPEPAPMPDLPPEPAATPDPAVGASDPPARGVASAALTCADVVRFEARCQQNARGTGIQARVTLHGGHDGASVTISVDGRPETISVRNGRAILEQRGASSGAHTIRLLEPAGCAADVAVSCSGR